MTPATVLLTSVTPGGSGLVTLRVPRELLAQLPKGLQLELVLPGTPSVSSDNNPLGGVGLVEADGSLSTETAEIAVADSPSASNSAPGGDLPEADGLSTNTQGLAEPSRRPAPEPSPGSPPSGAGVSSEASAPVPEPEWSPIEAGNFRGALKKRGLDYEAVCDLCESRGMPRPSHQGPDMRLAVIRRLDTKEGRAAYDLAHQAREQLIKAARALRTKERADAAAAAGLTETAPTELSARQLWALLSKAGPGCTGGRPAPSLPIDHCDSCGAEIVWIKSSKTGSPMPCNPEVITASPRGQGGRVSLILDDGSTRQLVRDPEGLLRGRISHFATCKFADQHRRKKDAA